MFRPLLKKLMIKIDWDIEPEEHKKRLKASASSPTLKSHLFPSSPGCGRNFRYREVSLLPIHHANSS
jgi:hypothetical protein